MDFGVYFEALRFVLTIEALVLIPLGVLLGMVFGALPGLTATMGVAILVPLTYGMDILPALIILLGMYVGAVYGGSVAAILVNIPGTPAAMMTGLDGHKMSLEGKAGDALGFAIFSSVIGGLIGALLLAFFAPIIGRLSLVFGYAEFTSLGIFGLTVIAGVLGEETHKGLLGALLGLFIAAIGMDPLTGAYRYTYGEPNLFAGISFIPAMIGLFGFRQILSAFNTKEIFIKISSVKTKSTRVYATFKSTIKHWKTLLRGSLIGVFIGSLPGAGGNIAAFLSYDVAKKGSSDKKGPEFGSGNPEGIIAAESANNALTGGSLIPLLTLGIPGCPASAVMIGAFLMQDLRPGPALFFGEPEIVTAIFLIMFLVNIAMLPLGLFGARHLGKILQLPQTTLMPIITLFCILGAFSLSNSFFDVFVMIVFGVIGFLLDKVNIPIIPVVLGIILGPIIEVNFRQALLATHGNYLIFFQKPISLAILILAFVGLAWPIIKKKVFL